MLKVGSKYYVTEYGAKVCDSLQTQYIQSAINDCFLHGGGIVVIPSGIFRTGGLRLRSNVTLYLESGAILTGSSDPEDYNSYIHDEIEPINEPNNAGLSRSVYPHSRWQNAIIRAIDAKNIAIIGEKGSYINGVNCYDPQGEETYRGPHAINMHRCENVHLEGYTITDSANWAHAIFNSQNITARNLTVYGGHDGFDVRTCDNVLIEDCSFYTGDDCIAGFDNHDVIIRSCIFDTACSALRFGGNNILVENCHSYAPSRFSHRGSLSPEKKAINAPTDSSCRHNMLAGFLYYCDFRAEIRRAPGDILIRNCTFENPDTLFQLNFGNYIWCCNRSLSSITYENCQISGVCLPIQICGDPNEPLTFAIKNSTISVRKGYEKEFVIDASHFEHITLDHVTLEGYEEPTAICRTEGTIEVVNSTPVTIRHTDELTNFQPI